MGRLSEELLTRAANGGVEVPLYLMRNLPIRVSQGLLLTRRGAVLSRLAIPSPIPDSALLIGTGGLGHAKAELMCPAQRFRASRGKTSFSGRATYSVLACVESWWGRKGEARGARYIA